MSVGFSTPAYCRSEWMGKKCLRRYCGHSRYCSTRAIWTPARPPASLSWYTTTSSTLKMAAALASWPAR